MDLPSVPGLTVTSKYVIAGGGGPGTYSIHVLNKSDGTKKWTYEDRFIETLPQVTNDKIYVGTAQLKKGLLSDYALTILDLDEHTVVNKIPLTEGIVGNSEFITGSGKIIGSINTQIIAFANKEVE